MRRFGEQGSKFARQGGQGGSMKKEKRSDGVLAERKVDQSEEKELEEKENEEDSGRESDDLRETEPHSFEEEEEEEEEDRGEVKLKEQGEEGKQGQEEENPETLCEKDPKEEMVKDVADWKGFDLNSDASQQQRGVDGVVVQFSYWTHGL